MAIDSVTAFLDALVSDPARRAMWESGDKDGAMADTALTAQQKNTLKNGPLQAVQALVTAENAHGKVIEESTALRSYGWIR